MLKFHVKSNGILKIATAGVPHKLCLVGSCIHYIRNMIVSVLNVHIGIK